MIFNFIVRHFRGLARVPFAPQLFDAWLLAWTALFHKRRLAAMEEIEERALELEGVVSCAHHFGGIGFVHDGEEFGHLHGNGLLDVRFTRERAEAVVSAGMAQPHHLFGRSQWVSFQVNHPDDVEPAISLLKDAVEPVNNSSNKLRMVLRCDDMAHAG